MIQVTIGRGGQLKCTEAYVIQSFVVNAEALIRVLNQLVDGEGCIVGLYYSIRDLIKYKKGGDKHS